MIDEATNTVTATIEFGHFPRGVAVDPVAGTVYVAKLGGGPCPASAIACVMAIDAATNTVTAAIPVGSSPIGVAVDPSTHTVYAANSGGGRRVGDQPRTGTHDHQRRLDFNRDAGTARLHCDHHRHPRSRAHRDRRAAAGTHVHRQRERDRQPVRHGRPGDRRQLSDHHYRLERRREPRHPGVHPHRHHRGIRARDHQRPGRRGHVRHVVRLHGHHDRLPGAQDLQDRDNAPWRPFRRQRGRDGHHLRHPRRCGPRAVHGDADRQEQGRKGNPVLHADHLGGTGYRRRYRRPLPRSARPWT